jgi:hypothetical protein
MRPLLYGGIAGFIVTAVVLVALRELTPEISRGLSQLDSGQARWAMIWLVVLGVVLGLVAVAGRSNALVSGVPAVLLFLVYLPVFFDRIISSWYPGWLGRTVTSSFGTGTPLPIIGVLLGVAGWSISRQIREKQPDPAQTVHSS